MSVTTEARLIDLPYAFIYYIHRVQKKTTRIKFLHILTLRRRLLVMQTILPSLQVDLDHRNRRQNTEASNGPGDNLNDLDLMAQTQATLYLALELAIAARDTGIGAFDVSPHLVNENSRDNP